MDIRRIVTGRTPDGKSVFVSDEPVAPVTVDLLNGYEFHRMWGSDDTVRLPSDGAPPPHPQYFPPTHGFRFGFFTIPPDQTGIPEDLDIGQALTELDERLPGLASVMEPDNPGMHTTDTVDYGIVMSGEVWLELDDGAEVLMKPGDCYVQNGTRHAWRNRSDAPCVIAVCLLGAEPPTD